MESLDRDPLPAAEGGNQKVVLDALGELLLLSRRRSAVLVRRLFAHACSLNQRWRPCAPA